jgi:predicted anti-sigma-YlaC factor YlaD
MSLKPTCREVHRLTSEGMDRELSLVERSRVRVHLVVCRACRTFTDQMALIRQSMKQFAPMEDASPAASPNTSPNTSPDILPDAGTKKDEP